MAYQKCEFKDGETVITAECLNSMQDAICQLEQDRDNHNEANNPHNLDAESVGARPDTWTPTSEEIGARPDTWMPTAEEVGAHPNTWVPTADEVGARPDTWMPTAEDVGARPDTWMPTAEDVGARPNTWLPSPADIGAINAASTSLSNMSVKEWAESLTCSAYAFTDPTTKDLPVEVSSSLNYAIVSAKVVAGGGWMELRATYVLTGCVAVCTYNYGWSEWEWENPPMVVGAEYRTTEQYQDNAVYTRLLSFAAAYPSANAAFDYVKELVRTAIRWKNMTLPYCSGTGTLRVWAQTAATGVTVYTESAEQATGTIYAQIWYTKN